MLTLSPADRATLLRFGDAPAGVDWLMEKHNATLSDVLWLYRGRADKWADGLAQGLLACWGQFTEAGVMGMEPVYDHDPALLASAYAVWKPTRYVHRPRWEIVRGMQINWWLVAAAINGDNSVPRRYLADAEEVRRAVARGSLAADLQAAYAVGKRDLKRSILGLFREITWQVELDLGILELEDEVPGFCRRMGQFADFDQPRGISVGFPTDWKRKRLGSLLLDGGGVPHLEVRASRQKERQRVTFWQRIPCPKSLPPEPRREEVRHADAL
jgi:hypothetical protein